MHTQTQVLLCWAVVLVVVVDGLTAVVDKVPLSHEMFLVQMVDLCVPHACNFQKR
jgi:hypothetical protein